MCAPSRDCPNIGRRESLLVAPFLLIRAETVYGSLGLLCGRRSVYGIIGVAGRAELAVSDMPQPPQGRIYEVWLNRGAGPRPTVSSGVSSSSNAGKRPAA